MPTTYYTAVACTVQVNRLTSIEVPSGTELIAIDNPMGVGYAIKDPHALIPKDDAIAQHDARHHYLWIDSRNVMHIPS